MLNQQESQGSASILVVDDNPLITSVVENILKSQHLNVITCINGEEASRILQQRPVDVILCDVMMPKMDGYQLHSVIRKNPDFAHIPFVFLTALGEQVEVAKGYEAGVDDYLVKPFEPEELIAKIKGKIKRSKTLKGLSEQRYDDYRKKVIHVLSHEFRTPLVAINTGTELLIDQRGSLAEDKVKNLLEAIRRGGQRLEKLVTDFMLLQQIEAGVAERIFTQRGSTCLVSEVVQSVMRSQKDILRDEGFDFKIVDYCDGVKVHVYEPQIHDILFRLIGNSIKFSPEKKELEILLYPQDGEVLIEVRDRGIGVDPAKLKQAMEAFGQIDRDKFEQQGGGLGLAIASKYAAINKGRLEFDRRQGGGSVVSLFLPIDKTIASG